MNDLYFTVGCTKVVLKLYGTHKMSNAVTHQFTDMRSKIVENWPKIIFLVVGWEPYKY